MKPILNFFETPRAMGNPFQKIVHTQKEINEFIESNNGNNPVFTSHNSYPTFQNNEPYQVNINKLFIDLDSKKPENALIDARKLDQFCIDNNIPNYSAFSGAKGFHIYILLRPQTYIISQYLKDATKSIHIWLKNNLSLRTLDLTAAEPKRLCRVWYTKHSILNKKTGKQTQNDNYCYPLTREQLHTWNIKTIIERSKRPQIIAPTRFSNTTSYITIDEFITKFDINTKTILDNQSINFISSIMPYKPVTDEFITKILPRPCIHSQIVHNNNPPHSIRFAAVIQLKQLGYDRKWIFDFFQARNYMDSHNKSTCAYQINHIFDHTPVYKHPTCATLIKDGLCIGQKCKKYFT